MKNNFILFSFLKSFLSSQLTEYVLASFSSYISLKKLYVLGQAKTVHNTWFGHVSYPNLTFL